MKNEDTGKKELSFYQKIEGYYLPTDYLGRPNDELSEKEKKYTGTDLKNFYKDINLNESASSF